MADDKYSQRVRGKMASTGRSKKADRMRKMNSKETLRGEDHDYGAVFVEGPTSVNATDLEVGENVELGSSKPWFQGRRVVELDVLARSMNCEKCSSWLRLSDIKDEVIYGMASFLYISCPSSACQHISLVPTGKKSNGKGFDINYKVCLGASSGIGEKTALLFAESKAKVVLASRTLENLEKVASLCRSKGLSKNDILVIPCDVTNDDNLKTLVDETVKKFGRIDVLVNNAGKGNMGNVMGTSEATLDETMNTNFKSSYNLSRLCVPHLIKTQGCIVNVSSVLGQRAGPHLSAYCIAKAALDMFTRLLALELAPQKVRVNSVNPGFIMTSFADNDGYTNDMQAKYLERLKVIQPLGGAGKPEDVAKAIRFLASDDASFTTGHLLFVDSGRHGAISS